MKSFTFDIRRITNLLMAFAFLIITSRFLKQWRTPMFHVKHRRAAGPR